MDLCATFKLPLFLSGLLFALYLCQDAPLPSTVFGHGEPQREVDGEQEGSSVGRGTVSCPGCLLGGLRRWLCSTAGVRAALCTQPSLFLVLLTVPSSLSSDLGWDGRPETAQGPCHIPPGFPTPCLHLGQ